jgi:hypothetical protein
MCLVKPDASIPRLVQGTVGRDDGATRRGWGGMAQDGQGNWGGGARDDQGDPSLEHVSIFVIFVVRCMEWEF